MGREAAAVPGYVFSDGYKAAPKKKVWNWNLFDRLLAETLAVAAGTQMIYWQEEAAKRAALIRSLESL